MMVDGSRRSKRASTHVSSQATRTAQRQDAQHAAVRALMRQTADETADETDDFDVNGAGLQPIGRAAALPCVCYRCGQFLSRSEAASHSCYQHLLLLRQHTDGCSWWGNLRAGTAMASSSLQQQQPQQQQQQQQQPEVPLASGSRQQQTTAASATNAQGTTVLGMQSAITSGGTCCTGRHNHRLHRGGSHPTGHPRTLAEARQAREAVREEATMGKRGESGSYHPVTFSNWGRWTDTLAQTNTPGATSSLSSAASPQSQSAASSSSSGTMVMARAPATVTVAVPSPAITSPTAAWLSLPPRRSRRAATEASSKATQGLHAQRALGERPPELTGTDKATPQPRSVSATDCGEKGGAVGGAASTRVVRGHRKNKRPRHQQNSRTNTCIVAGGDAAGQRQRRCRRCSSKLCGQQLAMISNSVDDAGLACNEGDGDSWPAMLLGSKPPVRTLQAEEWALGVM
eukprot:SAG25_NODE_671_length_6034_cov_47.077843_8_plen_458_part_00